MFIIRSFLTTAALAVALGCGGGNDRTPTDSREGLGGKSGAAESPTPGTPTPGERDGSYGAAKTTMSAEERQFAQKAAQGGELEVMLGKLAADKASNERVKDLGERIADDHERANRELQSMLGGSDVARTSGDTGEADAARQKLESLSGQAFDRAYIEEMIKHHQKDIAEFERAVNSMSGTIRTFAEKTLPTLREHLSAAQEMQKQLSSR